MKESRKIWNESFKLLILKLTGHILALGISLFLARSLGPSDFGKYSYVLTIIAVLLIPANFGFPTLATREIAAQSNHFSWTKGFIKWLYKWSLFSAGLILAVTLLVTFLYKQGTTQPSTFVLALAFCTIPLHTLVHVNTGIMVGQKNSFRAHLAGELLRPVSFAIFLLIQIYILNFNQTVSSIFLTYVTSIVITVLFSFYLLKPATAKQRKFSAQIFDRSTTNSWLRSILPLAITGGIQTLNKRTDILMMGVLATSAGVGVYKIAVSAALLLSFFLNTVNTVTKPYFAKYHKEKNTGQLRKTITLTARIVFTLTLLAAGIVAFGSEYFVSKFLGNDYLEAVTPVYILCTAVLVNCAFGPVISLLNMSGNESTVMKGVTLSLLLNLVLNFLLIPKFGAIGAASATLTSYVLWNSFLWYQCRRILKIDTAISGYHPA